MTSAPRGLALHLEKVLDARSERVFATCVDPKKLADWWGPAGFTCPSVALDLRPGGAYRITMQPPEGKAFHLHGTFREVDPPRRLAYTFEYEEPDPDDQETMVTLSFLDHREGTKLILDQGPFKTEARRGLHERGWMECLDRLEGSLSRE